MRSRPPRQGRSNAGPGGGHRAPQSSPPRGGGPRPHGRGNAAEGRERGRDDHRGSDRDRTAPRPAVRADLYGRHAVEAAFLNPARQVTALYVSDPADGDRLNALADAAGLTRPPAKRVERDAIDRMLPKGAVHQGMALGCKNLPEHDIDDFIRAADERDRTCLVILDQVTDPHNVGAIIRSCCALGAHGLVMQRQHAPELSGVLAKTACGGVEHLPVAYETNLTRSIEALQKAGFYVLGLDEEGDHSVTNYTPDARMAIVLGAEGEGLRRLVKERCDLLLRLPTEGPIASLNVSNAAAVALYALLKSHPSLFNP